MKFVIRIVMSLKFRAWGTDFGTLNKSFTVSPPSYLSMAAGSLLEETEVWSEDVDGFKVSVSFIPV